jgi:hypothetical protein
MWTDVPPSVRDALSGARRTVNAHAAPLRDRLPFMNVKVPKAAWCDFCHKPIDRAKDKHVKLEPAMGPYCLKCGGAWPIRASTESLEGGDPNPDYCPDCGPPTTLFIERVEEYRHEKCLRYKPLGTSVVSQK